jgi:preprotein translocase subunit SecD
VSAVAWAAIAAALALGPAGCGGDDEGDRPPSDGTTADGATAGEDAAGDDAGSACAGDVGEAGLEIVLAPASEATDDELDAAAAVLCERASVLASAVEVAPEDGSVVVRLPADTDRDRAVALVGGEHELRFRPVLASGPLGPGALPVTPPGQDAADATVVLDEADGPDGSGGPDAVRYQLGPTVMTAAAVETAEARQELGQWSVALTLRSGAEGIDLFNGVAGRCYQRTGTCPSGQLAFVVDSHVVSAPTITQPSYARDQIAISGAFDEQDAADLASTVRAGALPIALDVEAVHPD